MTEGLELARVRMTSGESFDLMVPTDPANFAAWAKIVRADGAVLAEKSILPWDKIVWIAKLSALQTQSPDVATQGRLN